MLLSSLIQPAHFDRKAHVRMIRKWKTHAFMKDADTDQKLTCPLFLKVPSNAESARYPTLAVVR